MNTKELLNQLRKMMAECTDSERHLLEELQAEAEGWNMRLQEMDEDEE